MRGLRKILLLAAILSVGFGAYARLTAASALKTMPGEQLGALSAAKVADLVEYANAGMLTHTERNAAGAEARILALDSLHAELQTGPGRMLTLDLLPQKGDTVIAVIETLTSQVADSRLTVYSRTWKPQPRLWQEPKASAWGKLDEVPIVMAEYSYDPATQVLTLVNTSELKEKMKPALRYRWTAKGFRLIKD